MKLGGPQNQLGGFGEKKKKKKLLLLSGFEPLDCLPLSLVTTLAELPRHPPKLCKPKNLDLLFAYYKRLPQDGIFMFLISVFVLII